MNNELSDNIQNNLGNLVANITLKKVCLVGVLTWVLVSFCHWKYNDSVGDAIFIAKRQKSEPSIAEVKVNKEEAKKLANKVFIDFFPEDVWEINKNYFKISSAELRTIHFSWKSMIPFYKPKPRVAWFIEFDLVEGTFEKTRGMLVKGESTIVLDATTNELICRQIHIVM